MEACPPVTHLVGDLLTHPLPDTVQLPPALRHHLWKPEAALPISSQAPGVLFG